MNEEMTGKCYDKWNISVVISQSTAHLFIKGSVLDVNMILMTSVISFFIVQ